MMELSFQRRVLILSSEENTQLGLVQTGIFITKRSEDRSLQALIKEITWWLLCRMPK